MTSSAFRAKQRKADIELLIKGVTCALIGLVILVAPYFMAASGTSQMLAQSHLVGWFALALGGAFVMLFAMRRNKARKAADAADAAQAQREADSPVRRARNNKR